MGKPIAGALKLPFGPTGMIVHGAKLQDGTLLKNLRIVKQRSGTRFDLIDTSTLTVHQKVSITGVSSTGAILSNAGTDDQILAAIPNGSFFIRVLNEDDDTVGYCTKLYNNLVHMSSGTFFLDNYNIFYAEQPETHEEVDELNGAQAAFAKVGKPNELMIGSGNSNLQMVTSTDGLIQVAMAARLWQPSGTGSYTPVVAPVDGTYTIRMDKSKGQEYTIPYSIGITSPEFVGSLTDLYDVVMTFYGDNTGKMTDKYIAWRVETINGKLVMVDDRFGRNITDSATTPNNTALQNIQRYKFYNAFLEVSPPPGEVPTGIFVGRITARRKDTGELTVDVQVRLDVAYL